MYYAFQRSMPLQKIASLTLGTILHPDIIYNVILEDHIQLLEKLNHIFYYNRDN